MQWLRQNRWRFLSRLLLWGGVIVLVVVRPALGSTEGVVKGILAESYQLDTVRRIIGHSAHASPPLTKQPRPTQFQVPREPWQPVALHAPTLQRIARYDAVIAYHSDRHHLDPDLVRAVIYAESGGNPNAVSDAGAVGLMQLMPVTAKAMGITNRFDPEANIATGTRYLGDLLRRFGSVPVALWAYNAGPGAVASGDIPLETANYVPRVLQLQTDLTQAREH